MGDDAAQGRGGFLPLPRSIRDDAIWNDGTPFDSRSAELDLRFEAAYSARSYRIGNEVIELRPGEFVVSIRFLAERWKWPKSNVHRFIKMLEKAGLLMGRKVGRTGTVYRVVGYSTYGAALAEGGTMSGTLTGTVAGQSRDKTEEGKKGISTTPTVADAPADRAEQVQEKAKKNSTDSPDVAQVLDHYRVVHPQRRPSRKDATIVARALKSYSAPELCEAIDGNAADPWHRERRKHEIGYVLRDNGLIDSFRTKLQPVTAAPASSTLEQRAAEVYRRYSAAGLIHGDGVGLQQLQRVGQKFVDDGLYPDYATFEAEYRAIDPCGTLHDVRAEHHAVARIVERLTPAPTPRRVDTSSYQERAKAFYTLCFRHKLFESGHGLTERINAAQADPDAWPEFTADVYRVKPWHEKIAEEKVTAYKLKEIALRLELNVPEPARQVA